MVFHMSRCQFSWIKTVASPKTPANKAPDTQATPPITRASTIGRPWIIAKPLLLPEPSVW